MSGVRRDSAAAVFLALALAACRTAPAVRPEAREVSDAGVLHHYRLSEICSAELVAHADACILRDSNLSSTVGNMVEKLLDCGQTDERCGQRLKCECEEKGLSQGGSTPSIAIGFPAAEERAADELRWSIDCHGSPVDCAPAFPDIKMDVRCPAGARCVGSIRRALQP